MLLKAIELEDSVVTKENTIVIKPAEEEIEIRALNEDDGAMLDIFADMPD